EDVDLEDVPPVAGIDLPRFLLADVSPSVCHEEVDRPQLNLHLLDHRLDGGTIGDVGDDREAADLARDRLHLVAGAGADGDARSCRGALARDALANSS